MKRKLVTLICLFVCLNGTQAQSNAITTVIKPQQSNGNIPESFATQTRNDTVMTVYELQQSNGYLSICTNKYDRVVVYVQENCSDFWWTLYGTNYYDNPMIFDSHTSYSFGGGYHGCGIGFNYGIYFYDPAVPTETNEELWIHGGELAELQAVEVDSASMYDIRWNTGEQENIIYKPAGTYIAGISDMCATAYRTKIVKESVEIDLATCDLESNLNMVTWQTTPAQAEYISQVEVKRDGLTVGTAPYTDGYFLDNIGSDAASRTYTVTALATDGTPCPIASYPKETIHMAYLTGINNTIEVNWNAPTGYDLLGYNICEWNANDGTLTTIDYVGASVNSYTCQQSQFAQGYIVIQGVEASKDGETRLLSNRSSETVGIGENESPALKVYPNPAQGTFTVEGTGTMSITNVLGQTVLTREIDGKESVELPQGIYFVRLNGATRKIVVE